MKPRICNKSVKSLVCQIELARGSKRVWGLGLAMPDSHKPRGVTIQSHQDSWEVPDGAKQWTHA